MNDGRDDLDAKKNSAAQSRGTWLVCKYALGQEPDDDLRGTTTAEERLAMMWPLALEAWSLTGVPIPVYDRASMPVRKIVLGSE